MFGTMLLDPTLSDDCLCSVRLGDLRKAAALMGRLTTALRIAAQDAEWAYEGSPEAIEWGETLRIIREVLNEQQAKK